MTSDHSLTAIFDLVQHHIAPPDTRIVHVKVDKKHHQATFRFAAVGEVSGFQCALERIPATRHKKATPKFSACASPKTYRNLLQGKYTFLVRAFNPSGPDPTPVHTTFAIH
jgi:hypothetical protein